MKLALANIRGRLDNQDISDQLIIFCTIYTNYNYKLQKRVKRWEIPWNKFRGLTSNGDPKISQKKKKKENEVLVCICFEIRKLVLILVLILTNKSGICLWRWDRVFVCNKCSYKHELNKHKIEI